MFKKLFNFPNFFFFLYSINLITTETNITTNATNATNATNVTNAINVIAKSVTPVCIDNNYYFQLNVEYNPQPTTYIPFSIEVIYPNLIIFRCMIIPNSNKIFCYANLKNNDIVIEEGEDIELPYPFPETEEITWDDDSFLSLVYRRIWKLENTCGSSDLGYHLSSLSALDWGFVFTIKSVLGAKCNINIENSSKFSFNFNVKILGGFLKNELDNNKNNNGYNIEFLNEIIMPFEIGEYDTENGNINFNNNKLYHVAFCFPENKKIGVYNYKYLITFICDVPLINQKIFKGPLRIKTFYDHLYVKINSNELKYVKMFFNTEQNEVLKNPGLRTKDSEEIVLLNKKIRLLQELGKNNLFDENKIKMSKKEETEEEENNPFPKQNEQKIPPSNNNSQSSKDDSEISQPISSVINSSNAQSSSQNSKIYSSNVQSSSQNSKIYSSNSQLSSQNSQTYSSNGQSSSQNSQTYSSNSQLSSQNSQTYSSNAQFSSLNSQTYSSNAQSSSLNSQTYSSNAQFSSSNVQPSSSLIQSSSLPSPSSSLNQPKSSSSSSNEPKNQNDNDNSQTQFTDQIYLILDNNFKKYYCPDRPIFKIINPDRGGIQYQSDLSDPQKFNLYLIGALAYGTDDEKSTTSPNDENNNEKIKFDLTIKDNFVKDTSHKERKINCELLNDAVKLPKLELAKFAKIKCKGTKANNKTTNVDFSLNVQSSQNLYFKDLVLEWPKELEEESKHIYSYTIQALSIRDSDFGCFENKFYFYIDIYDLNYEPKINFKIPLETPRYYKANCELYNSYTLKCYINLRLKKLEKGYKIELLNKTTSVIATNEGNQIVFDMSRMHYINQYLYLQESCGDNIFIGALKDIGFTYLQVILIIIGILGFISIVVIFIAYIILYAIIHKNRKGKYFAHREETNNKTAGNTNSYTGTNAPI